MAIVRAGCRIDLAGGTLDIWPLGLLAPGAKTVNVAIDVMVEVSIEARSRGFRVVAAEGTFEAEGIAELKRPETALVAVIAEALGLPPFELRLASESPRGGGLGGSSAIAVALLAAAELEFGLAPKSVAEKVHFARDLEARLMNLPTGIQDHYPALLGGALEISHVPGGEVVRRLDVDLDGLGRTLIVADSGASHFSAGQNWQIVRGALDGNPAVLARLRDIGEIAARMADALEAADFERAGFLLGEEWSRRRGLGEGVSTPRVESLLETGRAAGAWGGKVCGAGGGGCVAFLGPEDRRQEITRALSEAGAKLVEAKPIDRPLAVTR